MKIIYKSDDGIVFELPSECARHEFQQMPELVEKVNAIMADVPFESFRWCGAYNDGEDEANGFPCCCMGCVNHYFYTFGLTVHHWRIWFKEIYKLNPDRPITQDEQVDVILTKVTNKMVTLSVIRVITGLGVLEAKQLMDTPNARIKCNIDYHLGVYCVKQLQGVDCEAEIVRSKM